MRNDLATSARIARFVQNKRGAIQRRERAPKTPQRLAYHNGRFRMNIALLPRPLEPKASVLVAAVAVAGVAVAVTFRVDSCLEWCQAGHG